MPTYAYRHDYNTSMTQKRAPKKTTKNPIGAPSLFKTCRDCKHNLTRTNTKCTSKTGKHTTHADFLITLVQNGASLNRAVHETGISYQAMMN